MATGLSFLSTTGSIDTLSKSMVVCVTPPVIMALRHGMHVGMHRRRLPTCFRLAAFAAESFILTLGVLKGAAVFLSGHGKCVLSFVAGRILPITLCVRSG